jgi:hypothetical protein
MITYLRTTLEQPYRMPGRRFDGLAEFFKVREYDIVQEPYDPLVMLRWPGVFVVRPDGSPHLEKCRRSVFEHTEICPRLCGAIPREIEGKASTAHLNILSWHLAPCELLKRPPCGTLPPEYPRTIPPSFP